MHLVGCICAHVCFCTFALQNDYARASRMWRQRDLGFHSEFLFQACLGREVTRALANINYKESAQNANLQMSWYVCSHLLIVVLYSYWALGLGHSFAGAWC